MTLSTTNLRGYSIKIDNGHLMFQFCVSICRSGGQVCSIILCIETTQFDIGILDFWSANTSNHGVIG